jgi:two-component system NarL family sensor kinase
LPVFKGFRVIFQEMKHFYLLVLTFFLSLQGVSQVNQIDSLKALLSKNDPTTVLRALNGLCWELRFSNADTARQYGWKALEMAQKMENKDAEAEALNNIGITHEAQGDYDKALEYELKALIIRRNLAEDPKTAKTLNDIGIVYDEKGDYQKALEYYFEARKIFEKGTDLSKIAMVINNIGIVLKAQKEYKKVVGIYHEALTIYQKLNHKLGVAACHANLGSVFFNLNVYDSALFYSLQASSEFEGINNRQFLAASICNSGMAYHKLGREKEAIETLSKAKTLYEEYDNKKELAFVLVYLAGIDREIGNVTKGIEAARQGLAIAERIGAKEEIMKAHKELSLLYAASRNFEKAFAEYHLYDASKDSLFEHEKSRQISELQTRYETEKKEAKIDLLTKDNELKDIRLRENSLMILALFVLLTMLIGFGLLWQNRVKLKQEAAINSAKAELREQQLEAVIASQEEERKRFAADLHDGLGQMISALRLGLSKESVDDSSVKYALELLNDMNVEIRNIAFNLMPQVLMKEGLHEALKEFASRISKSGSVGINVQTFNLSENIQPVERIALYRICQEWVNNVIKYSHCRNINLQAVQHPEELVITIEDDGDGFEKNLLTQGQGNGWKNINSRLSLIHGTIEIDSQPDRKGTIAIITIPSR